MTAAESRDKKKAQPIYKSSDDTSRNDKLEEQSQKTSLHTDDD